MPLHSIKTFVLPTVAILSILLASCQDHGEGDTVAPPGPGDDLSPGWFVVSEIPGHVVHRDSFLIHLDDPMHIQTANQIIARQIPPKVVMARIGKGADGFNRNVIGDGNLWSWHVTTFLDFSDMSVEVLDGWPTFIESDVDFWMDNTMGNIGFWSYTITGRYVPASSG